MSQWHPLQNLPESARLLAILLLVPGMIAMTLSGPSPTENAPGGIIDLELAGDREKAQQIVRSWEETDSQDRAVRNVRLDFLFLYVYSIAIGSVCLWSGAVLEDRRGRGSRLGVPLAWGMTLAALLDVVENVALLKLLDGVTTSAGLPWTQIARLCAVPKFILIIAGLAYAAVGIIVWLVIPKMPKEEG